MEENKVHIRGRNLTELKLEPGRWWATPRDLVDPQIVWVSDNEDQQVTRIGDSEKYPLYEFIFLEKIDDLDGIRAWNTYKSRCGERCPKCGCSSGDIDKGQSEDCELIFKCNYCGHTWTPDEVT